MATMPGAFPIFRDACALAEEHSMSMVHFHTTEPIAMSLITMHSHNDNSTSFLLVLGPEEHKEEMQQRLLEIVQDESGDGEWEELKNEDIIH
jgi:hypothetical protein